MAGNTQEQDQTPLDESNPWALVNRTVSDLRRSPDNHSERTSQALLGETLRLLEPGPEWSLVRMEHDGYQGWIHTASFYCSNASDIQLYQAACNACVSADVLTAGWSPDQLLDSSAETEPLVSGRLPFGVRIPVVDWGADRATFRLPDGRLWQAPKRGLLPYDRLPAYTQDGIQFALGLICRFIGVPYLWGGRTPFGYDCSGLAQAFLHFLGINPPRDADQQFRAGWPVQGSPQPGDLLFFGEADDTEPPYVSHVAISLGGDEIIHANGSAWGVSYNSLAPASPIYRPWLREHLVGVRRFG
jgi:gamma-D-glutamyl-L-lysine dipeptidyl-peptidase